jgi:glycosyltransferase involved in cell wall biosynthesis
MKLCFVADARSSIALDWINYFIRRGDEVHLISTYPCAAVPGVASQNLIAVLSRGAGAASVSGHEGNLRQALKARLRSSSVIRGLSDLRYRIGPMFLGGPAHNLRRLITEIGPDLVHAMRIPMEGLVAARAMQGLTAPLVVSVWGNDFTFFAQRYGLIAAATRQALDRVNALHTDCQRDMTLAGGWGFDIRRPGIVLPGSGGVRQDVFNTIGRGACAGRWNIPVGARVVVNPRGFREYVRIDTFFQAIPLVLKKIPEAVFVATGMRGNIQAKEWVKRLGIADAVRLLPKLDRTTLADLFRCSEITVSPSEHDGTPNTLLEAMACGAFPIAGDIESLREWIRHGENGLLHHPAEPASLAHCIIEAMSDERLRSSAERINIGVVKDSADYERVMGNAGEFYEKVLRIRREAQTL